MSDGPWALELIDLRKKLEEAERGLDLCVKAFEQYRHTHDLGLLSARQFEEPMQAAMQHPAVAAAEKRRRDAFWRRLDKASERVAKWPAWKRGEL